MFLCIRPAGGGTSDDSRQAEGRRRRTLRMSGAGLEQVPAIEAGTCFRSLRTARIAVQASVAGAEMVWCRYQGGVGLSCGVGYRAGSG